jgi:hypothetical protein
LGSAPLLITFLCVILTNSNNTNNHQKLAHNNPSAELQSLHIELEFRCWKLAYQSNVSTTDYDHSNIVIRKLTEQDWFAGPSLHRLVNGVVVASSETKIERNLNLHQRHLQTTTTTKTCKKCCVLTDSARLKLNTAT